MKKSYYGKYSKIFETKEKAVKLSKETRKARLELVRWKYGHELAGPDVPNKIGKEE